MRSLLRRIGRVLAERRAEFEASLPPELGPAEAKKVDETIRSFVRPCWNVERMAEILSKEKPFFRMTSGGIYAVMNSQFVRVDKDRRPRKERKRARRTARRLAEATA
jgi:hypothetical protein